MRLKKDSFAALLGLILGIVISLGIMATKNEPQRMSKKEWWPKEEVHIPPGGYPVRVYRYPGPLLHTKKKQTAQP